MPSLALFENQSYDKARFRPILPPRLWDSSDNEESFFVRQAYFLGAGDPYKSLRTTLKAEIDAEAWASLSSDTSRPFPQPTTGRIAVKVINHLGDEVMKVFGV